jgi:hypothetical protein
VAMSRIDRKPPRQRGRSAEELLVEVVAKAADRLGDEESRSRGIEKPRDVGTTAPQHPKPGEGPGGDPTPDAEAAVPDRERAPRMRWHLVPARRQEVKPPADETRGNAPEGYLLNKGPIAPFSLPTARRDQHRGEDGDDVGEAVGVDEERSEMNAVLRRTGDRRRHLGGGWQDRVPGLVAEAPRGFCFRVKAEARAEISQFFRSEPAGSNSHPRLAVAGDWCPIGARQIIGIKP